MRSFLVICCITTGCDANLTPQPAPPAPVPSCVPNRDGMIDATEVPIALGVTIDEYVSSSQKTIDQQGSGTPRTWDFSTEYGDDTRVSVGPTALDTQWFAASFPGGQFVADAGDGKDGVYAKDDTALWLLGLASHDMSPPSGKTILRYDAPVAVLRFPLHDGDAWTETGHVTSGTLDGLPYVGTDTYEIDVSGLGTVLVPYVRFDPALRVRTHVTVAPAAGGATISRRQTQFFFECFGEITRAESKPNEPSPDFTLAATLRRFAL
ncbi:MAG TPA: hypothetical protein VL463_26270 [Kofleriaceae bacterium]|nr:hypothetical protein [Kofleriaceae bacterium]